jgi:DNA-binding response OmpR family regulator
MSSNIKQKILAIGNPLTVCRLSAKIDEEQFAVTGCESSSEAASMLEHEHFDVVIVDNLVHNAEKVCKYAAINADTPVALLLQDRLVDWRNLGELKVDGFILDGGTKAEFMARIRAYIRRKPTDSASPRGK